MSIACCCFVLKQHDCWLSWFLSLFTESESSDDEPKPSNKPPAITKQAPAKKPATASHDLFGADSDEDDMFGQASKPKPPALSGNTGALAISFHSINICNIKK